MTKISKIFRKFFDTLFLAFFGLTAFVIFIPFTLLWLCTFWWDRRRVALHRYTAYWAHFNLALSPFWRCQVQGREHADKHRVYVMVCNHQSLLDIEVLYTIHRHFKWVAKRELGRIPVLGWTLHLNRYMLIDRSSFSGSKKMLTDGLKNLAMGNSLMVFPEGTRTRTGAVNRFKDGAFSLARMAKVPILPVVLEGTRKVFVDGKVNYRQTFQVKILPEIPYEQYCEFTTAQIAARVQQIIQNEHRKLAPECYDNSL